MKGREFTDYLGDYQLLKRNPAPSSWLIKQQQKEFDVTNRTPSKRYGNMYGYSKLAFMVIFNYLSV
jgi:hypothetical protein